MFLVHIVLNSLFIGMDHVTFQSLLYIILFPPMKERGTQGVLLLFNDDHVIQLRSKTVVVRRWMNVVWMIYDDHMIPGDECGLNFLTFDLHLRKTLGKALN